MTRARVGLLVILVAVADRPARAQSLDGWQVSVDFLQIHTRGNDVHVGDVFTERQTLTGTASDSRLDYGVRYDPIVTAMDANRSVMVTAVYRNAGWGAGARGWRSRTEGSAAGSRRTAAPTISSLTVTGVRMWDNSIVPVVNTAEPSGISPVTFEAENSLQNLRLEGFAERLWIQGDTLTVAARFGVAHARLENDRREQQTQEAFVEEANGGTITTFENDVRLEGTSETTANLTGPLLALAGDTRVKRLRIDWLIGHAVLLGTAETSGEWIDIDDIRTITLAGGLPVESFELLNGIIEKSQDDRALVPVLDLQVKASVRVTPFLSLGGGVFSSTWFNLPVAPAFSIPDDWTDVQGTAWRQQTRDVTFLALSVFAGFGF